jgi:hypothetical protein
MCVPSLMTEMNSQSNSSTTPTTTRERVASQMLLSPSIGSGLQKEVDELKVQLADATRKSEKIVAGLNQEVSLPFVYHLFEWVLIRLVLHR